MTLLADSRSGCRGGVLPWVLLVAGSAASLSANIAAAEPSAYGRVIAAWQHLNGDPALHEEVVQRACFEGSGRADHAAALRGRCPRASEGAGTRAGASLASRQNLNSSAMRPPYAPPSGAPTYQPATAPMTVPPGIGVMSEPTITLPMTPPAAVEAPRVPARVHLTWVLSPRSDQSSSHCVTAPSTPVTTAETPLAPSSYPRRRRAKRVRFHCGRESTNSFVAYPRRISSRASGSMLAAARDEPAVVTYSDHFAGTVGDHPAFARWWRDTYLPAHPGPPRRAVDLDGVLRDQFHPGPRYESRHTVRRRQDGVIARTGRSLAVQQPTGPLQAFHAVAVTGAELLDRLAAEQDGTQRGFTPEMRRGGRGLWLSWSAGCRCRACRGR